MEYFYIASAIASLISFTYIIIDLISSRKKEIRINKTFGYSLIIVFACSTFIFWTWFYVSPANMIREKISEKSILVKSYIDGMKLISIMEGEVDFDCFDPITVHISPFKKPPSVNFIRIQGTAPYDPYLIEISTHHFIAQIDNSAQMGKWKYIVRGELLHRVN